MGCEAWFIEQMKISDLLKRSPVVALFLWVLLVSSTVLSLSEAKNPTKLQMTNSLNFQPPLKNLVKSQHHQLLQLQQDQNNIIYDKDDTNQLLNQVSVSSSSSTRKQAEITSTKEITRIQNIQIIIGVEIGQIEIEKANNIIQINYEVKQRWIVL